MDTTDEEGPCHGVRSLASAEVDVAVGFALCDEVHELSFKALGHGGEGGVHVESDFDVDQSGETTYLDVVVKIGHLRCWLLV